MTLAPVIVFTYNRVEHTKQAISSLENNVDCKDTDLFIFSDGAKPGKSEDEVLKVRDFLREYKDLSRFKTCTIVYAEKNKGLATSVIDGVTDIINRFGRVIVVEDDLIVSKDFLKYMNGALDYYEKIENIWSICGYTFDMKALKKYNKDVYISYRGGSWGWATWADRWNTVDWNVSTYQKLSADENMIARFNRGGGDMFQMLTNQMNGVIDSWAIRWGYEQFLQEKYTIYPAKSLVANTGCDGSGTHSAAQSEYNVAIFDGDRKFEQVEFDKKITKDFKHKFDDTLKKKIKRNIRKITVKFFKNRE